MTITYIGTEIKNAPSALSLSPTYFLIGQDPASDVATKFTLNSLDTYLNITTRINSTITTHINAIDPHGDRAFATNIINNHNNLADAHGHKTYSDGLLTAHNSLPDPHGHKAYTNQAVTNHLNVNDPHEIKPYVDQEIEDKVEAHETSTDPHGDRAYVDNLRGANNGLAPLDSVGKISTIYLPSTTIPVSFITNSTRPITGTAQVIYANTEINNLTYWNPATNNYESFTGNGVGAINSTDDLPQGSNADRRYFTLKSENDLYAAIVNKISTAVNVGSSGESIFRDKIGASLNFKKIIAGTNVTIIDSGNTLTINSSSSTTAPTTNSDKVSLTVDNLNISNTILTKDGLSVNMTNYDNVITFHNSLTHLKGTIMCLAIVNQDIPTIEEDTYSAYKIWDVDILVKEYFDTPTNTSKTEIISSTLTEILNTSETLVSLDVVIGIHPEQYLRIRGINPVNTTHKYRWLAKFDINEVSIDL